MLYSSCTSRIEKKLSKFIAENQAGMREGSVTTAPDIVETIESPDVWVQLRRELEDVGISAAIVEEHHEFIASWMKDALRDGLMQENEPTAINTMMLSKDFTIPEPDAYPPPPSDSGYGSIEPASRRPSDLLSLADGEFETDLKKQLSERSITAVFDPLTINVPPVPKVRRKPNAFSLVKRVFQKETAIIQAASDGDLEKVAKLISLGMDVNARDRWGWSALSMCGYGGHKAIAQLLLDHNANLDNVDVDGDTPYELATNRGHTELVVLFDEVRAERDFKLREMDTELPRRYV
jgi:hypothetical protein